MKKKINILCTLGPSSLNKKFLIHAFGPRKKVVIMNIKKTIDEIKNNSNLTVTGIKKIYAFRKKR